MVKLRLRRRGRKRLPIYDIVAADSRSPRDGRYIEKIGQYNPLIHSGATILKRERAAYWLETGAQPTDTVRDILSREGLLLEMTMKQKGESAEAIAQAVASHVAHSKSREQSKGTAKKEAPPAEEEVAAEASEEVAAEATEETAESATAEAAAEVSEEATEEAQAASEPVAAEATEESSDSDDNAESADDSKSEDA